jgi:hypothetical protein
VLGPVDYFLWLAGILAEATVLVCAVRGRALSRYFVLNLYMLATLLVSVGRLVVFFQYGYRSPQYSYFYYYSDAMLSVLLFFVLMSLFSRVFEEMHASRYVLGGALLLLALTALFSYQIVADASKSGRILTIFTIELSRNLYFVRLVLVYILWVAVLKLKSADVRLVQIVTALGAYLSAFAANYALHSIAPGHDRIWMYLPTVMGVLLPLSWAYTFAKVPEGARLAPGRMVPARGGR